MLDNQTIGTDYNPAAWGGVTLSADTTNGALILEVTGAAATRMIGYIFAKSFNRAQYMEKKNLTWFQTGEA